MDGGEQNKHPEQQDPELEAFLAQAQLDSLDLSEITQVDFESNRWSRWLQLINLLALTGLTIWLPQTNTFLLHRDLNWLLIPLALLIAYLGWSFAQDVLDHAHTLEQSHPNQQSLPLPTVLDPSFRLKWWSLSWLRYVLLSVIILGILWMVATATPGVWSNQNSSFALVILLVIGVWNRLIQFFGERAGKVYRPRRIRRAPAGRKWLTLAIIVTAAMVAAVGPQWLFRANESNRFLLSTLGFGSGVAGAIWLARRFDEAEEREKQGPRLP